MTLHSEPQLQRDLHQPGVVCVRDLPESRAGQGQCRLVRSGRIEKSEIGMIEDIERLHAEFGLQLFRNAKAPEEGHVGIQETTQRGPLWSDSSSDKIVMAIYSSTRLMLSIL